jgi:hypothetical protein
MDDRKTITFEGREYFDDRLYVLIICPGRTHTNSEGLICTTIYFETVPPPSLNGPKERDFLVLATYFNSPGYPLLNLKHFLSRVGAEQYLRKHEPQVPLISLGGKSSTAPLHYSEFQEWKQKNQMVDFSHNSLFTPGGSNPQEMILLTTEQFHLVK